MSSTVAERMAHHAPQPPGASQVRDEAVAEAVRSLAGELRSIIEERPVAEPVPQEVTLAGPVTLAEPLVVDDEETRAALQMFAAGLDRLAAAVESQASSGEVAISDEQLDRIAQTVLAASQPQVDLEPLLQAVKGIKFPQMSVGGGELREVKLRNTSDVNVDPAVKEGQDTANTHLAAIETAVEGTLTVAGSVTATGPLTDGQLRMSDVKVSLDGEQVAVSNFPAVQPVSDNGGTLTVDGTVSVGNFPAVQPVSDNGGSLTVDGTVAVSSLPTARTRDEDVAYLYFDAGGVTSVAAATWVTLASITVPTGKTLRLINAEGDLSDLSSIGNGRAIRIRKAGTVMATALTGADQPNPDIQGLTLTNASGGNETWDVQGRHNDGLNAHDMTGWFAWVDVT